MTDPYRLLRVAATADDETIRLAYLAAIRDCPPERDRQHFEQVRAAYEAIASARARLSHALFDTTAPTQEDVLEAVADRFQPRLATEQRLLRVLGGKPGGKA
jgi:curved DNA-binding protein CbpA